jgi:hypothetical protein
MSKSFDIKVYQTEELTNWCDSTGYEWRAAERAETYIEGAFDRNRHDCNVVNAYETVDPPKGNAFANWSGNVPCSQYAVTYDDMGDWWRDRLDTCSDLSRYGDVDVLLFDNREQGGITIDDHDVVVNGGREVADADSTYQDYGCGTSPLRTMQDVLHEVAHALMQRVDEHELAEAYSHSEGISVTPMVDYTVTWQCDTKPSDNSCDEMAWSSCVVDSMEHTG